MPIHFSITHSNPLPFVIIVFIICSRIVNIDISNHEARRNLTYHSWQPCPCASAAPLPTHLPYHRLHPHPRHQLPLLPRYHQHHPRRRPPAQSFGRGSGSCPLFSARQCHPPFGYRPSRLLGCLRAWAELVVGARCRAAASEEEGEEDHHRQSGVVVEGEEGLRHRQEEEAEEVEEECRQKWEEEERQR